MGDGSAPMCTLSVKSDVYYRVQSSTFGGVQKAGVHGTHTRRNKQEAPRANPLPSSLTPLMYQYLRYREPDYSYQINVRYATLACHQLANSQFFEGLLSTVRGLIDGLTCELTNFYHSCHAIKEPEEKLQNELFLSFRVDPFGKGWEEICSEIMYDCEDETNARVQKARDLIEKFFIRQPNVLKNEFGDPTKIYYIEHSIEITRIDNCRSGFGKNEITHNDCANCCVVCDPNTFNSMNNVHCQVCNDIRIPYYGATTC
ncbi:zona pellucida-binding 2 [Pelobates cultripes]|uniref:Zona pellucida-binding 2 n=1 Tax=Pelobates cultripes TaxID=61616 RepID=A0AAD1SKH1_PELCU|nr:zona pellucida-binding 2 [Pelobates cultripes]